MLSVLFITNHYPPDIGAASNRSKHVVKALRQKGLRVDVLTSRPVYPNPTLYRSHTEWKKNNDSPYGRTRYLSAISKGYTRFPFLFRLINQLIFFMLASFFVLRKGRHYALVVTSSPPFPVNAIGMLAKIVYRCKWVTEIRDLWPASLNAVGKLSRKSLLYKLLKRMELFFYRTCDGIALLAPGMERRLELDGIPSEKLTTITNGIPEWIDQHKQNHVAEGTLTVRYIGTIGHAQDFTPLLRMARQNPDIRFELIGEGMYKNQLKKIIRRESLVNVYVKSGIVNKEEIIEAYLGADVGYIGLKSHDLFAHVIPSKLFEYGALGIPIVYFGPPDSDCSTMIQKYGLGEWLSATEDVGEERLRQIIKNYLAKSRVKGFRRDFSWDAIGERYYEFLRARGCLYGQKSVHDSVESFHN